MQIHVGKNQKEIKSHGDYEFPVHISVEKIESYEQGLFLWHWHPEIELTWVMSGEMKYHVNDAVYMLKEGDFLFGNCNTLHAGFRIEEKECTYFVITLHPRFLYGYEGSRVQHKFVSFVTENEAWPSLKLAGDRAESRELGRRMEKIYQLSQDPPQDYELQVQILLLEIWRELYSYFEAQPKQKNSSEKYIQRLRDMIGYMQNHYDQEISLEDIAAHVNLCKSECCRFFKKHMQMTIIEYLMFLRIQKSLPLLRAGESVTKTAGLVGFTSVPYFGQIFKRYMKCTPMEYKVKENELK